MTPESKTPTVVDTSKWPAEVKQIQAEELAFLGRDGDGALYWDGKQVEMVKRIKLSIGQTVGAVIVGVAAVIGGLGSGFKDGAEFLCSRQYQFACPLPTKSEPSPAIADPATTPPAPLTPAARG